MVAVALVWLGTMAPASDLRDRAWVAAQWALANQRPEALADSLRLYLAQGGNLRAGDPFSALDMVEGLRAMPGGGALAQTLLATGSRGQFGGASRIDIVVEPGGGHQTTLQLAAGEVTWIEARLWRGAGGADIDLELQDADGAVLAADVGRQTGTEGVGALLQVWTETCQDVTLRVANAGTTPARVAILIPQSVRATCEDPG